MCGIAGALRFRGEPVSQEALEELSTKLRHRGLDSSGINKGGAAPGDYPGIGLVHRRLSIIDLSTAGSQPMIDRTGGLRLVYNGELYNFKELRAEIEGKGRTFSTHTDTEVVLQAYQVWGTDCVRKFNGMFAFALWDETRKVLFCARDHLGIKPFYYVLDADGFAFASESRSLSRFHRNSLDRDALLTYYLGMYVPGTWSIFSGVRKLAPASTLLVHADGRVETNRYWSLGTTGIGQASDEAIEELLDRAVKRQLQADVPLGVFLSGGVDSSIVAILASKTNASIASFSVGYEAEGYDELPYAHQVAARYLPNQVDLKIRPADILPGLKAAMARSTEPIADSAFVSNYLLSKTAAERGVKVILNGTGGDEIFGGYLRYIDYSWQRYVFNRLPPALRRLSSYALASSRPDIAQRIVDVGTDMFLATGGLVGLAGRLCGSPAAFRTLLRRLAEECFPRNDAGVDRAYAPMAFDLQIYLPDQLLLLLDQTTMGSTIEGRVPLLDIDVVTAAFSLPFDAHVRDNQLKLVLKRIAGRHMPPGFFERKKQGFGGPVFRWVSENFDQITKELKSGLDAAVEVLGTPLPLGGGTLEQLTPTSANELFRHYCFCLWYRSL